MALTRHSRIGGYELERRKKLIVVSSGDQGPEGSDALFGD